MKVVDKVFSIPGRLRLRVWEIYRDYGVALNIRTNLYSVEGIKLVKFNIYSCSILVLYDETKLDEQTIYNKVIDTKLTTHKINLKNENTLAILTDGLCPFKLLQNRFYKKIFLLGLAFELFLFILGYSLNSLISIAILSNPFIFKIVENICLYHTVKNLSGSDIFTNNIDKIKYIFEGDKVAIDEGLITQNNINLSPYTIRKLELNNKINIIDKSIIGLVFKLREEGINNLYILAYNTNKPVLKYIEDYLFLSSLSVDSVSKKDRLIVLSNDIGLLSKDIFYIKVFVFNDYIDYKNIDFYIYKNSLEDFYKIFRNSFLFNQYIKRIHSIISAVHMFLILVITRGILISPIFTIFFSLFEILISDIVFDKAFLSKEQRYEDKYNRPEQT